MRRTILVVLLTLAGVVLSGRPASSQPMVSGWQKPVIQSARPDEEQGVLTIEGVHFNCERLHVWLDEFEIVGAELFAPRHPGASAGQGGARHVPADRGSRTRRCP